MKKITFLLLFVWILFTAHEFWLAPGQYRIKPGKTVSLDLLIGEDFQGNLWGARTRRTQSLVLLGQGSQQDLTAQALASDSLSVQFKCKKPGTYLLAMRSQNSFLELEGDKFNAYLEEDGIENILALREQRGELDKPAREFYQRCAKSLLQAGKKTDETYNVITGMPLEIIPLQNPYTMKPGDVLPVQILFENKPLPNVVVRSWYKMDETKTRDERHRTNAEGIADIKLDARGYWMISLVRMIENNDKSQADYQSYWASLTFAL
ncbi:MAG TPA: DUF4198 domain-containing protein [Saprospiraceae bacterium]|nr:DUF4198 domain-containing protein [Saprospiraceae bacterium]HMP23982.1 DUF4198 domain-containing protein [Saprospiraceae bacterium]